MGSETNALLAELKRDAEKGELLLWASARGLTADVKDLVQTGADPSAKDKHARQAVHYAASNGHIEILEYLFTKGVLLDAEDDTGRAALHYAAAGGHTACVLFLLGKECWRDAPDSVDDTPLHLAARSGNVGAVRALMEAGAKLVLCNKRCLTPFAEAVLAGRIESAELLGSAMEGGLPGAVAATYLEVPLLHLAAGLGQVTAVEWLVQRQGVDVAAAATERCYTPIHAAALSGDPDTVAVLLKLGADPLSQTHDGKLPLELVPRAAPPKASQPQPTEDPDATAASSEDSTALVRASRRTFRALARAAAEHGGVELDGVQGGGPALRKKVRSGGAKAVVEVEEDRSAMEEMAEDEGPEYDTPAAICLRQLLQMTHDQKIAKVESYARMDERQVHELAYLDMDAQAAVAALCQAMAMVELFGAVAALRADEDFQSDIRNPMVRDALADAKRTNDMSRYEDQAAVMSVAAKFKRLHAVSRRAGGLQVVIDDLRAELPGNDPASTAIKFEEMRAGQRASAEAAVKAVLSSVSAQVSEHVRDRIAKVAATATGSKSQGAADATKKRAEGGAEALAKAAGKGGERAAGGYLEAGSHGDRFESEEDAPFLARMKAQRERMDRLRAAATSTWSAHKDEDQAVGFVDRLEKEFEEAAVRPEGKRRRLADYVGEEIAQSLVQTFRAVLMTAAAFLLMWLLGLMPHQQTATLLAKEEKLLAAAREQARLSQLEGLGEGDAAGTCTSTGG